MADELSAPLSKRKGRSKEPGAPGMARRHLPLARIAFGLIAIILAGVVLRVVLVQDPDGGRPSATVPFNSTHDANAVAGAVAGSAGPPKAAVTITPGPETGAPTGASVIHVDPNLPDTAPEDLAATPVKPGILPDLSEETKDGPIPRVGAKGQTPFATYARPSIAAAAAGGKPLIAIVVTGLGLNADGTLAAIDKLPGNVTLAFAPYGKSLDRTISAARASGHELLLETPMEPFDYPDNDPGPQTLLTNQPPRANLDKLNWLMARFGGYVGLINHTGARFTASAADFGPVMEELGTRGLGYLDDGTSNRSLAPQLAATDKVPFGRADIVLDTNPARAPILAALDTLVARAKANGTAIGVISALPVSIQTITEWTGGLADRNVLLVPVSALMK